MKWTDCLREILWPNRCPGCGKVILPQELLCEPCGEKVLLGHDAYCHACGKVSCLCEKRHPAYDKAVVSCRYADEGAAAIIRMKRSENTNIAYFSARILAERLRFSPEYGSFDCVMPVPMHRSKQQQRGYNQASLIAAELGRLLGLPLREDVLYKEKSRYEQHNLNAGQRYENVRSFGIRDIRLDGMRILLCDDVLTTGATMDRCAALLKQNGAAFVTAAAAAATVPPPQAPTQTQGGTP